MKDYFTKMDISGPKETEDISITTSPIVRELYFRDRFKEIENPEKLAMELEQETKKQPIYRKLYAICKKYSSYKESKRSKSNSCNLKKNMLKLKILFKIMKKKRIEKENKIGYK